MFDGAIVVRDTVGKSEHNVKPCSLTGRQKTRISFKEMLTEKWKVFIPNMFIK